MGDFLQLSVKRRQREGFLDSLIEAYNHYKKGSPKGGDRLREILEAWLVEDKLLSDPPEETDTLTLFNLAGTIMSRVCEVSGHAWIEFVEGTSGDSIHGAANSRRDEINAYVAEFVPKFDRFDRFDRVDKIIERFGPVAADETPWHQITPRHVVNLLAPFLEKSKGKKRKSTCSPKRDPRGAVPGHPKLIPPSKLREQPSSWLKDRRDAWILPAWRVDGPSAVIRSFMKERSELRYSFTPEHYSDAENCVTWASGALDRLVPGDWLKMVQTQCAIKLSQLHKHKGACKDCHIREQGQMLCTAEHAIRADEKRKTGLRRFST